MERVLIVGGGLAGCALAMFLTRKGHEVQLYERHADVRNGQASKRPALNITLCERGLNALAKVGLRDPIQRLCVPVYGRRVHALDGSIAYQPYDNSGGAIYSVSRSDLNDALIDAVESKLGLRISFGQKCAQIDSSQGIAHFQDSDSAGSKQVRADRIFGCDGAYSTVRMHMQKLDRFNYSQRYWTQGYSTLRIPARADGSSYLEPDALHIWPRGEIMLIAFPNRDRSMTCSLLLSYKGENSYESLSTESKFLSFFRSHFPDAVDLIDDVAGQFFAKPANSLLTVRCDPWSVEDRVLLIGDAAHAFLPSYGQGANAAFEDCSVLDECLSEHPQDWKTAFQNFEGLRRPNTDAMADLCVEHFGELTDLVGDPNFLKRREIERLLSERYPDLYQQLYSMITFTRTPYAEAIRIDREQRTLIDEIMRVQDIESKIESPEVEGLLRQSVRGTNQLIG